MKNLLRVLFMMMLGFSIVLTSCNKDDDDGSTTPSIPSDYTTTSVMGVVFDENHDLLGGVEITIGNNTYTSNWDGSFMIENVTVNKDRFLTTFKSSGYLKTVKTEKTISGGITRLDVTMISLSSAYNTIITPSIGGDLSLSTDGNIHFPAGLNYIDENGNPYSGSVYVYAKYLDASMEDYSRYVPGGDQYGEKNGEGVLLQSIGGMIVELSDGNGGLLNLDPNNDSLVSIETTIPTAFLSIAPDTIDSWYSGGNVAYSSNEGSGRKEGGKYLSEVGHFSYWSLEKPQTGSATISGQVTDTNGDPVSGVRVNIGQTYAVTDNNGYYSRIVPAGLIINVQVLATDFNNYSSNLVIQPALSDGQTASGIDLVISIPTGDMIRVYGKLVGCNSQAVAGKVLIQSGSFFTQTYTLDGTFSLLIPFDMTGVPLRCEVNGEHTEIWIYPSGVDYDAGDIQFCPPPVGSNEITVDGSEVYSFTQSSCYYNTSATSLYIDASDGGSNSVYFEIMGYTGVGTYTIVEYNKTATVSIYLATGYYTMQTGTLTVTEDGGVGGRVIGTFTGTTVTGETITGKFNALRSADEAK